jgi:hypothetical protein
LATDYKTTGRHNIWKLVVCKTSMTFLYGASK